MTREEAKELLPIIQAYSEGKTIEYLIDGKWVKLKDPAFNYSAGVYRVKPEQMYRPFQNVEECWKEMKKHEPFGWLTNDSDTYFMMDFVGDTDISIPNAAIIGFDKALNLGQKFADGTPFGVKEED